MSPTSYQTAPSRGANSIARKAPVNSSLEKNCCWFRCLAMFRGFDQASGQAGRGLWASRVSGGAGLPCDVLRRPVFAGVARQPAVGLESADIRLENDNGTRMKSLRCAATEPGH